jgi:hypothetical protein
MDNTIRDNDVVFGDDDAVVERRKLSWSAIFAGVVATLGIQVLMMYIGAALGISAIDPYNAVTYAETNTVLTVIYLVITALASSFFGAWIAGHWANLYEAEDAYIHGALTWALSAIAIALGLGAALQMGMSSLQAGAETAQAAAQISPDARNMMTGQQQQKSSPSALAYDPLNDQRFASFVLNRAKSWAAANPQRKDDDAVNVSADRSGDRNEDGENVRNKSAYNVKDDDDRTAVDPDDVAKDDELAYFVSVNSDMSEDQAEDFLDAEKESIAQAQETSMKRWERENQKELAAAKKAQDAARTAAWVWTGLALLALFASIGGSYLGWRQRYNDLDEDELTTPAGTSDEEPRTGL